MKKVILSIALAAISCASFAQNFGVKAGANFSSVADNDNVKPILGCYIGGVADLSLPVANLGLRIEPAYSMQGFNYEDVTLLNVTTKSHDHFDYINVPVMLEYKLLGGDLALMAGPQVGFCLGIENETTIGDNDPAKTTLDKDDYNALDFGVTFGATYMVTGNVGVDLRYNLGLSQIIPDKEITSGVVTEGCWNNRVLSVGVCYMF